MRLTAIAWRLARGDSTMLALAVLSALFSGLAIVTIFWFGGYIHNPHPSRARLLLVSLVAAWPFTFIGTFINVALAAAADAELDGRRLTLRQALGVSTRKTGQIALWSLLAAGVGQLLAQLGERIPFGGRIAAALLGTAWGLVTFFAVPVLAIEGCSAPGCVKRSAELIKQRWGESVAGTVAIYGIFGVLSVVAMVPLMFGFALLPFAPAAAVPLLAVGGAGLVLLMGAASTIRNIFSVALYRYAVDGEVTGGFPEADLQEPFRPRRRGLFGR